jgi:uncharacterized OB-fold protein
MNTDEKLPPSWLRPAIDAAARDFVAVRRCLGCGRNHYPPREICPHCTNENLSWDIIEELGGETLAQTLLYHTNEERFRNRLPLRVGLIRLDIGFSAVAFLADACRSGERVKVLARLDEFGHAVLTAIPSKG